MTSYKHRRLQKSCSGDKEVIPKVSRARKISTEADTVVSFVRPNQQCSASNFEKKFYLKRNAEIVEQRMCYTTRYNIHNKKELIKILRMIADKNTNEIVDSVNSGCINEAQCTEFVKTNLTNTIPIINHRKDSEIDLFTLRNVSYDTHCNKYTRSNNSRDSHFPKITTLKKFLHGSNNEEKVGDIYLEYTSAGLQNVSFYVIIQLFEKPCSFRSSNTKQNLKKLLCQASDEIRHYNLSAPGSRNVNGVMLHENKMEQLLLLDISNWKKMNYKFKSSKDESFYKQIRRKNRSLCEV